VLDLDAVVGKCIGGNPETGENALDTATTVSRTFVTRPTLWDGAIQICLVLLLLLHGVRLIGNESVPIQLAHC